MPLKISAFPKCFIDEIAGGASLEDPRQGNGMLGSSPDLRHGVTGRGPNDYNAIFRIRSGRGDRGRVRIEDGMNGLAEMAESLAFLRRMAAKYYPEQRHE